MGDSEFGDPNRPRKYHEGWVQHQPGDGKGWKELWMVLRGEYLYIFKNDRTASDSLIGTLHLGTDTQCRTLPGSKKSYKIEVVTTGKFGDDKVNLFKFQKENDRDVWKSFIVGISVAKRGFYGPAEGIVPSDVHLLPGQLKDVHMAIDEVRNRPPPLPATIPRPKVIPQPIASPPIITSPPPPLTSPPSHITSPAGPPSTSGLFSSRAPDPEPNFSKYHNNNTQSYHNNYDDDRDIPDNDSNHSGSFRSHLTRKTLVSSPTPTDSTMMGSRYDGGMGGGGGGGRGGDGEVLNLRQLRSRQQDLVTKSLVGSASDPPPSPWSRTQERTKRDYGNDDAVSNDSGYSPNHNQTHLFYANSELNRDTPPWFFDNMPREDAESILTCGRKFGNVLMRPSSTFHTTQKYVISMRREVAGGTNLNHYEVVKRREGLKINVDNDHAPMRCLSEVMDFFVNVAGPGTKPMRTNDLSKIYSATMSNNSSNNPTSPGPSQHSPLHAGPSSAFQPPTSLPRQHSAGYSGGDGYPNNGLSSMDRMAENSFDVRTPASPPPQNNWSFGKPNQEFHRQESGPSWAPPPTNDRRQKKLNVTGQVDSGIATAVSEMNDTLARAQEDDWQFEYQNVNANGNPPPPQTSNWRGDTPDYGGHNDYSTNDRYGRGAGPPPDGGYGAPSLNQPVPSKLVPSNTLQRAAEELDRVIDDFDHFNVDVPAKQAPGSGGIYGRREQTYGRQGEYNGAVPPPPTFMPPPVPPPPPATGGGIPPPPPINSQGFRTLANPGTSAPPPPPPQQQQGFSTTPARGNNGGARGGGGMDFEDELKGRLGKQREQIYATGATVLRSNWN